MIVLQAIAAVAALAVGVYLLAHELRALVRERA